MQVAAITQCPIHSLTTLYPTFNLISAQHGWRLSNGLATWPGQGRAEMRSPSCPVGHVLLDMSCRSWTLL